MNERTAGKLGCDIDPKRMSDFIKRMPNARLFIRRKEDGTLYPIPAFPFGRLSLISPTAWLMLLNDSKGCCVISGVYHQGMDEYVAGGKPDNFAETAMDPLVQQMYDKYGAGGPGKDEGTDPTVAMQGLIDNGFPMPDGSLFKAEFYFVISLQDENGNSYWDATIQEETEYMLAYFGGGGLCMTVTQGMIDLFNAGKPWTQANVDAGNQTVLGGHYTYLVQQKNATTETLITWAKTQDLDFNFIANNCSCILFPATRQMINAATGKDPEGLDWSAALALYNSIKSGGLQPPAPVTVASITVTPATATVPVGSTVQLKATATMSDGSTQDVTASCNWQSADLDFAAVSAGLVTGIAVGPVKVLATSGTIGGSAAITVTPSPNNQGCLSFVIGKTLATFFGKAVTQDVAPQLSPTGHLMVELTPLIKALGGVVAWDAATQTATVTGLLA
jgi:uncharacterized protein YjdB